MRVVGGWTVNSIVTIQSGFPFTPQLSFNPSNDGDSKNPVRPSWNPAFTGPVILGGTSQWFNPQRVHGPAVRNIRQRGQRRADRPRPRHVGFLRAERYASSRTDRICNSARRFSIILNRTNLNTPNLIVFTSAASERPLRGWNVYANIDDVQAGAIRLEAAVVRNYKSLWKKI